MIDATCGVVIGALLYFAQLGVSLDDSFLQLPVAVAALFILFWFLRQIVERGMVPFVKGTLENQQQMVRSMSAIDESFKETAAVVRRLHERIETMGGCRHPGEANRSG